MQKLKVKLDMKGPMFCMRGLPMGTIADGVDFSADSSDDCGGPGTVDFADRDLDCHAYLFCGATLVSAVYMLLEEQPDHPYLQPLLVDGIDVLIWDTHIPPDMIEWIKDEGRSGHTLLRDPWSKKHSPFIPAFLVSRESIGAPRSPPRATF